MAELGQGFVKCRGRVRRAGVAPHSTKMPIDTRPEFPRCRHRRSVEQAHNPGLFDRADKNILEQKFVNSVERMPMIEPIRGGQEQLVAILEHQLRPGELRESEFVNV